MSKEEIRMAIESLDELPAVLANETDKMNVRKATDRIEMAKAKLEQALRYYDVEDER